MSQSCDHVHLGTSAIQVNERDTGEQAKKYIYIYFLKIFLSRCFLTIYYSKFFGTFLRNTLTDSLTHRLTESRTYIAA